MNWTGGRVALAPSCTVAVGGGVIDSRGGSVIWSRKVWRSGHQRPTLHKGLADDRPPLLEGRCLQGPHLSLCRCDSGLIGTKGGLGRLELGQGCGPVFIKCLRALKGGLRGYELGLSGLQLGTRRHIIVVQCDQLIEVKHRSVGTDLILVRRALRRDHLNPALLSCLGVERHEGLTMAVERHAQGRLDLSLALGFQSRFAPPLDETPNNESAEGYAHEP